MSESENIVPPIVSDLVGAGIIPPAVIPTTAEGSQGRKFPLLTTILLILLSLTATLSIYLFLQVRTLTLEKTTPSPSPSPMPSPDPTDGWQTITNSGLLYTIELPKDWKTIEHSSNFAETYENYESSSGQRIDIVKDKNPRAICRGDCPGVESSTATSVGSYPATKDMGYIGEVGGNIAHRFITFNIPNGPTSLNITFHPSTTGKVPGDDIVQISDIEVMLFDQILSTFKFTDPNASPITASSCQYQGKTYKEGESLKIDSCNTCSCSDGQIACTLMACE